MGIRHKLIGALLAWGVILGLSDWGCAVEVQQGVVFAEPDGQPLRLDIATPAGGEMRPAIVLIHGGGWRQGARADDRELMGRLAARGFVVVSVDYRLTDQARWPAQIQDVQAALRWLVTHAKAYGIDAERIAVMGESAGAHLSLMAAVLPHDERTPFRIRAVGNLFGFTDFTQVENVVQARSAIEALVGGRLEDKEQRLKQVSPVTYVDRGDPPVFTLHGREDTLVPVIHAETLHEKLTAAQIPNRLELLDHTGHSLGTHREKSLQRLADFFTIYLRGADLPLVAFDNFDSPTKSWQVTDDAAWELRAEAGRDWFSLIKKKSDYQPQVRSPHNLAMLEDVVVSDFVFDVDMRSTNEPYGHQDLCLFFGYQDPTHFYYVHFGREADAHANSIFLVNDAPRVSIATERTNGTDWSRTWHRARIRRNVDTGEIQVFFDDMTKPVMVAKDSTFTKGRVGVGSFDDTGDFDSVRLWGRIDSSSK